MPARPPAKGFSPPRGGGAVSVAVAVLAIADERFVVLVRRATSPGGHRWELPWHLLHPGEDLSACALRALRGAMPAAPMWIEQMETTADARRRHPAGPTITIGFAAASPLHTLPPDQVAEWLPVSELQGLSQRQRPLVDRALRHVRDRIDVAPIAFRLLTALFTLGDLQVTYEVLLGCRLHKASFRRALQAAHLVKPTDEWRRDRRGRPAQLYRYAPRRRKGFRRAVRFDLLRPG